MSDGDAIFPWRGLPLVPNLKGATVMPDGYWEHVRQFSASSPPAPKVFQWGSTLVEDEIL